MLEVERLLLAAKAYPAPGFQALAFHPDACLGVWLSVPCPHPTFHSTLGSAPPSSGPSGPLGRKDTWVWRGQSQAPHVLEALSPVTAYGEMSVIRHQGCSFTLSCPGVGRYLSSPALPGEREGIEHKCPGE